MYPFNWPLSKYVASVGIPLFIKVEIIFDKESSVYIATSPNAKGLVVEADTLDDIRKEVLLVLPELLSINHHGINNNQACLQFNTPLHA